MDVHGSNNSLLVQALDKNKDGILQSDTEIKLNAKTLKKMDGDQNQQLSLAELTQALDQDRVSLHYTTGQPARIIDLKPEPDQSSSKMQGLLYGMPAIGALAGMGIGALAGKITGKALMETGFVIGGAVGVAVDVGIVIYSAVQAAKEE